MINSEQNVHKHHVPPNKSMEHQLVEASWAIHPIHISKVDTLGAN